jgi:hypoxanthine phosphoribosyltransferase
MNSYKTGILSFHLARAMSNFWKLHQIESLKSQSYKEIQNKALFPKILDHYII